MTLRVQIGARYRAGPGGVRVVEDDGSESAHPEGSFLAFTKQPERVEGRLIRIARADTYETQDLRPEAR